MTNNNRLLIVDDDREISGYIEEVARSCGYAASVANTYDEFVFKLAEQEPSVVLLDLQLPSKDGVECLNVMSERKCRASLVLVSGVDPQTLRTATDFGKMSGLNMCPPLPKPFSIYSLRRRLAQLMPTESSITRKDLERAIRRREIRPHYQPIMSMVEDATNRITGVEALARWYRSEYNMLLPAKFLGLIEEEGLMHEFTDSMVRQVSLQLKKWSDKGRKLNGSINLSPSVLTDRYLPDRLEHIVQSAGIENSRLTFEATEELVLAHTVETLEVLSRLRVKGFGLSIDDFGTGYSSLQQLYKMPFSELKIDRSFIEACENDKDARIIVEATVDLGHKLGLEVCAEGVETEAAFNYLRKIGCDRQQGYFIGKPRVARALFRKTEISNPSISYPLSFTAPRLLPAQVRVN